MSLMSGNRLGTKVRVRPSGSRADRRCCTRCVMKLNILHRFASHYGGKKPNILSPGCYSLLLPRCPSPSSAFHPSFSPQSAALTAAPAAEPQRQSPRTAALQPPLRPSLPQGGFRRTAASSLLLLLFFLRRLRSCGRCARRWVGSARREGIRAGRAVLCGHRPGGGRDGSGAGQCGAVRGSAGRAPRGPCGAMAEGPRADLEPGGSD